ncbi:MAG: hypothetical protein WA001_03575 [Patescibacteria group bacterium]
MQPDGRFCTLGHEKPLDAMLEDYLDEFPEDAGDRETAPPDTPCTICNSAIRPDDAFCPSCGSQQIRPADAYLAVENGNLRFVQMAPPRSLEPPAKSGERLRPGTYRHVRSPDNLMPDELSIDDVLNPRKRHK